MSIKLLKKLTVVTASAALSLAATSLAQSAQAAGFGDSYNPSTWTLTNTNADGSVNTTSVPGSFVLTGGNKGSGNKEVQPTPQQSSILAQSASIGIIPLLIGVGAMTRQAGA
jgi:hypothetical protein